MAKKEIKSEGRVVILKSNYNAITVDGKKSMLRRGQCCTQYDDGRIVANDGRVAKTTDVAFSK